MSRLPPARILIATPTANGDLCAEYCETIVQLLDVFGREHPQVTFDVRFVETFDLRLVRNAYASMVLNDPAYTHLLFFDSDMGFFPTLVEKMLASGKPVVGVVSPMRNLDNAVVADMARRFKDIRIADIAANKYIPDKTAFTIGYDEAGKPAKLVHAGSIAPVSRCGTGIMLMHRSVFETLRDRLPEIYDAEAPEGARAYGVTGGYLRCFDAVASKAGLTLGEDYAFSNRWVERCGGEIHLVIDEVVFHVGERSTVGNARIKWEYRRQGRV